jgi:hypothetical protein
VAGVVASGVADDDVRIFRQHVNDFAFAFVAPLGADQDCVCHKYLNFLRRRSSAALPTTIKIPERKFGAKRMSLRKEARDRDG